MCLGVRLFCTYAGIVITLSQCEHLAWHLVLVSLRAALIYTLIHMVHWWFWKVENCHSMLLPNKRQDVAHKRYSGEDFAHFENFLL